MCAHTYTYTHTHTHTHTYQPLCCFIQNYANIQFELNLTCSNGTGWILPPPQINHQIHLSPDDWSVHGRWGQIDGFLDNGLYIHALDVQFVTLPLAHLLSQRPKMHNLYLFINYLQGLGYHINVTASDPDGYPTDARASITVPRSLAVEVVTTTIVVPCDTPPAHMVPDRARSMDHLSPAYGIIPQLISQFETTQEHSRRAAGLYAHIPFRLGIRVCRVFTNGRVDKDTDSIQIIEECGWWTRVFDGFLPGLGMFMMNGSRDIVYNERPPSLCPDNAPIDRPFLPSIQESVNALRALGYTVTISRRAGERPLSAHAHLMIPRNLILDQLVIGLPPFDNY
jgi:hypothetical protein